MHSGWRTAAAACAAAATLAAGACGNRTRTVGGTGPTRAADDADAGVPAGGGGGPDTVVRRALHVAVEFEVVDPDADPPQTAVDLVMTDETGAADRAEIGEFPGTCTDVSAANRQGPMKPVLSVDCAHETRGTLLRFVPRLGHLIVLRSRVELGSGEEPAFDEHVRIPVPTGVPLVTD